ncbi:MAG TPA: hypothetical protein VFB78_12265 [Acidimicrobiales bacterium]|nr:hypothetical protein [Acidimicrobiales bacterium]
MGGTPREADTVLLTQDKEDAFVRRIKLCAAALAISAVGVVGLAAPASATTNIGTPPGTLIKVCVTVRPDPALLCIYV